MGSKKIGLQTRVEAERSRCERGDGQNSRWTPANPAIKEGGNAARHRINNSLNYEANKTRSKANKKKKPAVKRGAAGAELAGMGQESQGTSPVLFLIPGKRG